MSQASNMGQLQEFSGEDSEDFEVFSEKLEQHFVVKNIKADDPRRTALLITGISNKVYKLLQDLCFPIKPKDKKYSELVCLLSEQLIKKRSVFAERYKFHRASQNDSESIQEWTARLKRLSAHCNFGTSWDTVLRDRFIVGLRQEETLNRLFGEDESLTFNKAVDIAIQLETAKMHAGEVKENGGNNKNTDKNVYRYETNESRKWNENNNTRTGNGKGAKRTTASNDWNSLSQATKKKCRACGKVGHLAKDCKYVNYRCRNCKQTGHLAIVCKSATSPQVTQNKYYSAQDSEVDIFHLGGVGEEPFKAQVSLNGIKVLMEIDSGAGVSTMSFDLYKKFFSKTKLEKTTIVLVGYTQARDRPIGVFTPEMEYAGIRVRKNIFVIKNGGPPLLGHDLMKAFNMGISPINSVNVEGNGETIIKEFSELFKEGLGTYKYGLVKLKLTKDANPVYRKPRALPFIMKELVEKELEKLVKQGMLTQIESSEWGTPLVPIIKKDGTLRLCADYKVTLNKHLENVKYPLPKIEELFLKLEGGKEFTKLDLSQAYNQLRLDEESSKLATWSTHKGLFRVNRLPYGVTPAAAKFQMMIEQLLQGLEGVVSFLDDIVVTGRNKNEHMSRLRKVLNRLLDAGLRLKKEKCQFFMKEIGYLGHIISAQGLRKDPAKVKAIMEAERPNNVTQLRSFIGMVAYYGKFVPKLSTIMNPLYQLLNKGTAFVWSKQCEEAFTEIKQMICSEQILTHYNPELPVRLTCDASMVGIGAVLSHVDQKGNDRPIAYTARTLSKAERNYPMVQKEALAIYYGVKHFHQYLYGKEFTLLTDHKPLLTIFGEHREIPVMAAGRLQRWASFLSGYHYQIKGIAGKDNFGADYLSRIPNNDGGTEPDEVVRDSYMHFIESKDELPVDVKKIRKDTRNDPQLGRVLEYIDTTWPAEIEDTISPYYRRRTELTVEQGCIMWGYRVIVPTVLRPKMLEELHASHMGVSKMKALARSFMWWPGLDQDIEKLSQSCVACIVNRPDPNKTTLIPWSRPAEVWSRLHLDFLGPIKGTMYLIIIDAFSKWPEVVEVKAANAEMTVQETRNVMARYGLPRHIVTDNGRQFTSAVFQGFLKKNGIKHTFTAPGHPATNGQAENGVKSFKNGLYKALSDTKNTGTEMQTLIARYLMGYRNATHSTTLETPAKYMFGRQLKIRLSLIKPNQEQIVEDKQAKQCENFKGRRDVIFREGEKVVVRDYHDVNNKQWKEAKVEKCLGRRTYLCKLPDGRLWKRHTNQIQEIKSSEELPEAGRLQGEELVPGGRENNKDKVPESKRGNSLIVRKRIRPFRKSRPPSRLDI